METLTVPRIQVELDAYCHDCKRWHRNILVDDRTFHAAVAQWWDKHAGHDFEFLSPQRRLPVGLKDADLYAREPWWMQYHPNADLKLAYASSANYTITLASLATSSTLVTGRASTAVSNTTNLYLDYLIGGQITVGTTPTANTSIELWAYPSLNDTPLYPDSISGTDAAKTFTTRGILQNALALTAGVALVDTTTSNRVYFFRASSLEFMFGRVPKNHGVFVTHNTAVNLNSTAGNHILSYTGVYVTN